MHLIRAWLEIQASPLDYKAGWKPFLAWLFIFLCFSRFYDALLRLFAPLPPSPEGPDTYTLAQAEIEAECARKLGNR